MASPQSGFPESAEGRGRLTREVATRVFAAEYNAADLEFKEGGERSPSYVITPLGAKVNRLLAVGVLTSNEKIGAGGDMWRAQVTDPTGVFNVYAGQYQPEAARALSEIRPPAVVAIVGKSRTYAPEEGVVYTSIRPENVRIVDVEERDRWILETAKHTLERLEAVREATKMEQPTEAALEELGTARDLAEGIVKALGHYKNPDVSKYASMLKDAVESLLPGGNPAAGVASAPMAAPAAAAPAQQVGTGASGGSAPAAPPAAAPAQASTTASTAEADAQKEAHENTVLALVEKLDDGKGAPWEDIVAQAGKEKLGESDVEEALNSLMDKGQIYEPVLGKLKKT